MRSRPLSALRTATPTLPRTASARLPVALWVIPAHGVKSYVDVKADDEQSLMDAVAKQPVSVAIEADQMAFQLYKSGVLTKTCGTKLDHGVLVVGYGTEDGTDYWLVGSSSKHKS